MITASTIYKRNRITTIYNKYSIRMLFSSNVDNMAFVWPRDASRPRDTSRPCDATRCHSFVIITAVSSEYRCILKLHIISGLIRRTSLLCSLSPSGGRPQSCLDRCQPGTDRQTCYNFESRVDSV